MGNTHCLDPSQSYRRLGLDLGHFIGLSTRRTEHGEVDRR